MTDPARMPATPPVKTLGATGLVLAIFFPVIGLIVSLVARSQARRSGVVDRAATAGIVVGLVEIAFYLVVAVYVVALFLASGAGVGGAG